MAGGRRTRCVGWVEKYFRDCVCDLKTGISFTLGMMSLVSWGVAEIPQIITNFKTKSAHGVSLGLLLTWIVGDVFNLVGCLLEPATLPTQLYTAVLYTLATVILVLQTIYYDYWPVWCKSRKFSDAHKMEEEEEEDDDQTKPLNPKSQHHDHHQDHEDQKSKPIPTSYSSRADVVYTSARSLANSGSSPYGSSSAYLRTARSGPPTMTIADSESSSEEELENNQNKSSSSTRICGQRSSSKPTRTPSLSVGYGTFLAASAGLIRPTRALLDIHVSLSSRKLLADARLETMESDGVILGWIMAAIYMGGRLPQIYLNIKRGSVEGLNPLMFIFALIANATYVGSILVRSTEWKMIKANAPWLLDALVCVLLDLFIMVQYTYYRYFKRRETPSQDHEHDYYEAATKLAS